MPIRINRAEKTEDNPPGGLPSPAMDACGIRIVPNDMGSIPFVAVFVMSDGIFTSFSVALPVLWLAVIRSPLGRKLDTAFMHKPDVD